VTEGLLPELLTTRSESHTRGDVDGEWGGESFRKALGTTYPVGADAYLVKNTLRDWDDDHCLTACAGPHRYSTTPTPLVDHFDGTVFTTFICYFIIIMIIIIINKH